MTLARDFLEERKREIAKCNWNPFLRTLKNSVLGLLGAAEDVSAAMWPDQGYA